MNISLPCLITITISSFSLTISSVEDSGRLTFIPGVTIKFNFFLKLHLECKSSFDYSFSLINSTIWAELSSIATINEFDLLDKYR
jgi:hypothetical protein